MSNLDESAIVDTVLLHHPAVQGIYLFGSFATGTARPQSDVDIALLLSESEAEACGVLAMSPCSDALGRVLRREVDLVNAREVSTVFQKEIIAKSRTLLKADAYAVDEFEMLVFSYYQKLNEERAGILQAFRETGRAYDV